MRGGGGGGRGAVRVENEPSLGKRRDFEIVKKRSYENRRGGSFVLKGVTKTLGKRYQKRRASGDVNGLGECPLVARKKRQRVKSFSGGKIHLEKALRRRSSGLSPLRRLYKFGQVLGPTGESGEAGQDSRGEKGKNAHKDRVLGLPISGNKKTMKERKGKLRGEKRKDQKSR